MTGRVIPSSPGHIQVRKYKFRKRSSLVIQCHATDIVKNRRKQSMDLLSVIKGFVDQCNRKLSPLNIFPHSFPVKI